MARCCAACRFSIAVLINFLAVASIGEPNGPTGEAFLAVDILALRISRNESCAKITGQIEPKRSEVGPNMGEIRAS